METKTYNITKGQYLTDILINYMTERDAVSSNGIFDKTIPGLSATHREILVHRYSIIIELNIPVIKDNEIETYLASTKI